MMMNKNDYNTNNTVVNTVTNKCRHFVGIAVTITMTVKQQKKKSINYITTGT